MLIRIKNYFESGNFCVASAENARIIKDLYVWSGKVGPHQTNVRRIGLLASELDSELGEPGSDLGTCIG